MKNILISAPFGYSIKNLLYSSFWQSEAIKNARSIYVLSPVPELYDEYFKTNQIKNARAIKFDSNIRFSWLFQSLWQIKKTVFLDKTKSETQKIRWSVLKQENIVLYVIKKILVKISSILPEKLIDYLLEQLTTRINWDMGNIDTWLSLAPSFEIELIVSKYINHKHPSCKKVAFIHSWDNLSSKGSLIRDYDKILVWGPTMKDEVETKLNYKSENIIEVGMPQYDSFYTFIQKTKTPKLKQFLYTTGHPNTIPNEFSYVNDIAEVINKYFSDHKLIIRAHPNDNTARYRPIQKKFPKIIKIEEPGKRTDKTCDKWMPFLSDVEHFADILTKSKAVINIASTVTIDASYFLTPVICLNYNQETGLKNSIKRFYDYDHYKVLLKTRGVILCNRKGQLHETLECAVLEKNKNNQKKLISIYDPFLDGKAGLRIGDNLE